MAAFEPFQPLTHSAVAGSSQTITLGAGAATSQTIQVASSISQQQNCVLATLTNYQSIPITAYCRLSVEVSTSITTTNSVTDCPIAAPATGSAVRLFASPNPGGAYNIAVILSVTGSTGLAFITFTPGQGGIV